MKEIIKTLMRLLSRLAVLPFVILYFFAGFLFSKDKTFQCYSQFFSLIPGLAGEYLRREFYRLTLKECSKDCCISFGTIFSTPDVVIGRRVYIGAYCLIGHSRIGDDALLASRVSILSGLHQHGMKYIHKPIRDQERKFEVVSVGEDCWLGEGAIIGAHVGAHSVIAAGSVVFEEVEPFSIMKGNPAALVRYRTEEVNL